MTSPGLDGAVHEQHEAADEIRGDGLQAESQAQADGAGEHGERGQIDAGGVQAHEDGEPDQEGIGEFADADARRGRDIAEPLQAPLDPAADPGRDQHEQSQGEQELQHRPDRDPVAAGCDADAVEACDDGIEPAEVLGGDREPDEQREAGFPMLHPGFVAEAGGEQEHAETHDDVRADQVRRRLQHRDVEMRRHETAGDDHEKQTDEDGQDHDAGLRREIIPGQRQRRRVGAPPGVGARHGAGHPARGQAERHRADLDQHIACGQDVEERRDTLQQLGHALRSGISWLSSLRDLVLEQELAPFEAFHLQLVDFEVHGEAGNDVIEVPVFDAQLTQALDVLEQIGIDVAVVAHGSLVLLVEIAAPHRSDAIR